MAHGIFRDKAKKNGLKINIESAGTSAFHIGEFPDSRAIAVLSLKGINITDLRSRLFIASDFDHYDYIFTMDSSNQMNVKHMGVSLNHAVKTKMIMNLIYPNENISVPDPYYGGSSGFEDVYKMLDIALDQLIIQLT
jgi:protein-tyrosine phosphatase